jgi:uncharacterized protein
VPEGVDIEKARASGRRQAFSWRAWAPEVFAEAKREGKLILVHGAAVWCHWCHVMEETTYTDPAVGKAIARDFVAIRVDVDSRPDIEDRYDAWGWPATIILSPDAEELAKYRGYIAPKDMLPLLSKASTAAPRREAADFPAERPAAVEALSWIGANSARRLDSFFDDEGGSWGFRQKAPIGANVVWEIRRHRAGDPDALGRAVLSLDAHAKLIDPAWGGIYQYSTGGGWDRPHFEKLMTYQASNLEAFAAGYAANQAPRFLSAAKAIADYLDGFLSNDAGAFLVSQDADVGTHDPQATFMDGNDFYPLTDAERRRHGVPWVDDHVYAEENGLAIAALCSLFEASGDARRRARARRAADALLRSHVDAEGRVLHDAASDRAVWYLADAAQFGFGLARLAAVHPEGPERERYLARAVTIAEWLKGNLTSPTGALWAHTEDPDATGVFARRRTPYEGNVVASRLFAALGKLTGDATWTTRSWETLAAIATPRQLRSRGRMIGTFLLALEEAGVLVWR